MENKRIIDFDIEKKIKAHLTRVQMTSFSPSLLFSSMAVHVLKDSSTSDYGVFVSYRSGRSLSIKEFELLKDYAEANQLYFKEERTQNYYRYILSTKVNF